MTDLSKWDSDNTLYLFTSLTAGSTHVVTATSRIETILRANRIPFTYIDTATNEEARKLYSRRAGGKKFPLLVKEGYVLGGITEVEEWNEFGELHDEIGEVATVNTSIVTAPQNADFKSPYGDPKASAPVASSGSSVASKKTDSTKENIPALSEEAQLAMARASSEIASIASEKKKAPSIASTKTTQSKSTPDAE
ncbi:uncharacterized protein K452DRAFT_282633 [Aplosporella prunicola CBS 121167]|uniref:Uncharacterized protein n=1 Tax=Aplosporella prunicola CBS 121167 TaxID=1176127 RepID=A0A6A6BT75_9PEZI|nr:uncharacterized protein K452DRAFT_282633 [Aplosporella prunicola CBS 121167]KAF2146465.1 hypothetical protein K452DRAFT_282633 [Aplosporella prunicola CBS 121167]